MKRLCIVTLCLMIIIGTAACTRANREARLPAPDTSDNLSSPAVTEPGSGRGSGRGSGSPVTVPPGNLPPVNDNPYGNKALPILPYDSDGTIDPYSEAARLDSPPSYDRYNVYPPISTATGVSQAAPDILPAF